MRVIRRDPSKGYLDRMLWVPKNSINVTATQSALSFVFTDGYTGKQDVLYLWEEAPHHLLVPRSFWAPGSLMFDVVDCRPQSYRFIDFKSRIVLDHRPVEQADGSKVMMPTGDNVQRLSIRALTESMGGVLQLACVTGDTILSLNRGGKGFKVTIEKAYERWSGRDTRYAWKPGPTFIRAHKGEHIGLQRIVAFIDKGFRSVHELKLADGKTLKLTPDHEVLTPRGYLQARLLKPGDEVIVDGKREKSVRKKKLAYRRIGGFNHHPHARFQSRSYCIEEHRAVMEAAMNGLTLEEFKRRCKQGEVDNLQFVDPAWYHAHHKDGNIYNNELYNLEVLPKEEHLQGHRPGYKAFGQGVPTVVAVERCRYLGEEQVYDVMCEGPHHNFVANGIVVHNCGKGKTVVALENIAREKVPAIIVLDNTNLLYQWADDILEFLEVPGGVGYLMSGKDDWEGRGIVLATYQTIAARAEKFPETFKRNFGSAYFDEGHHVNAPTYSKGVSLIYGRRFSLTATPERDDGQHIVADFHIGKILHKDLKPTMIPDIIFKWTDLQLNILDPAVVSAVMDVNGEIHMSKVKTYFGQWRDRMWMLMQNAIDAMKAGRKVLLLSDSVDEIVNLMTMWTRGPHASLITDIPYPTLSDIGEAQRQPAVLAPKEAKKLKEWIENKWKRQDFRNPGFINDNMELWQCYTVHRRLENENNKRRTAFLKQLLKEPSTAGLMTFGVPPKVRQKFLDEKQVVFAITKYGKEGLDCPDLDTILVSSLFSSRNPLQQLLGRPTRPKADKRKPLVVFFVDHVGQCIGMAEKLQRHLRAWPHEEGGPYAFELLDYPRTRSCKISNLKEAFGQ